MPRTTTLHNSKGKEDLILSTSLQPNREAQTLLLTGNYSIELPEKTKTQALLNSK